MLHPTKLFGASLPKLAQEGRNAASNKIVWSFPTKTSPGGQECCIQQNCLELPRTKVKVKKDKSKVNITVYTL